MTLYYAVGSGLGHLTRARRVLEILGLAHDAAIITASPDAHDDRITGGISIVDVPPHLEHSPDQHRAWVRDLVRRRWTDRLIVDAFPGGIQGELCGLEGVRIDYVARLLRWDAYRRVVPAELPRFDTTYVIEELTTPHEAFVRRQSGSVAALDLTPAPLPEPPAVGAPFWLIVHSGTAEEVHELVAYTSELRALLSSSPARVLVASRCKIPLPAGFEHVDVYPASPLFPLAERVFSGAGFNVMFEMEPWRTKHEVVPFARRFDDQHLRAARRRERSAGERSNQPPGSYAGRLS